MCMCVCLRVHVYERVCVCNEKSGLSVPSLETTYTSQIALPQRLPAAVTLLVTPYICPPPVKPQYDYLKCPPTIHLKVLM